MSIFSKTVLKRTRSGILAGAAAVLFALPAAGAAQFRQVPPLPVIPPSITFPGERDILTADLERLKGRISKYESKRADYRRDCAQRLLSSAVRKRQCSSLAQEIHRDISRLRTAIVAMRNRFSAIEQNALQRPRSGVPAAGVAVLPDKRPRLIAEALSTGGGSWRGVLDHVKSMLDRSAGDPAVRDVSAFLMGVHAGRIAADRLDNGYYKHGVRRALAGDHWSAALAFAQAARDTPGDLRVFESYADAAGRQHAGPACVKSDRCVSGNIAVWVKRFGRRHDQAMKQIVAAARKGTLNPQTDRLLKVLGAIAVYAAKKDVDEHRSPEDAAFREMAGQALAAYGRGERQLAVDRYIRLWKLTEPGRAPLFLFRYAETSGIREAGAFLDHDLPSARASRIDDAYLAALKEVFAAGDRASPFEGKLSQAQIIRLQR